MAVPDGVEDSDGGGHKKSEDEKHVVHGAEGSNLPRVDAVVVGHGGKVRVDQEAPLIAGERPLSLLCLRPVKLNVVIPHLPQSVRV